jgi:RNA polymerase sigma factor (sigma-70 family)
MLSHVFDRGTPSAGKTPTMTPPRYDLGLLQAARGGDKDAILVLLELAQPDIRRYARQTCAHSDDVNDAVQEALWLMYRRVGTLQTLTSFSAWLFAVVRRECLRLSHRIFGHAINLSEMENSSRLSNRPPLELRVDLARAIESLPEHYREVVLLRDIEERTIDEIAHTLSRSREAVKANLHRARALLREYLSR